MTAIERGRFVVGLAPPARSAFLSELSEAERRTMLGHWPFWAREGQLPPKGDWRTWLVCAGRGFGKTRTGAEWVRHIAHGNPDARIALVASSLSEARAVLVEGESGIMAVHRHGDQPVFESSLRRLVWGNGAQAVLYSAGEPESLRGPQHSHAWCDEIGKWDNASQRAENTWDNLMLGLRLGDNPQALATTTPRAVPLVQRLFAEADKGEAVLTRGSTQDNASNLSAAFMRSIRRQYGQTALGRAFCHQAEGAFWVLRRYSRITPQGNCHGSSSPSCRRLAWPHGLPNRLREHCEPNRHGYDSKSSGS